jgi:hypothetical protein
VTTWHAGRILEALAHYFDWQRNFLMPEYEIGGRADLVVITRARYVTEVEIKVTLADWRADAKKPKWSKKPPKVDHLPEWQRPYELQSHENLLRRRAHVSRFFYAIPESLADKIPADLPEGVGIVVAYNDPNYSRWNGDRVRILREAVRRKSTPMSEDELARLMVTCYYRYWNTFWDLKRLINHRRQVREMAANLA